MHKILCPCTVESHADFVRMAQWNETNLSDVDYSLPLTTGESPLNLMDLTVGTHQIKIIPEGCGRMFWPLVLSFKFTIN